MKMNRLAARWAGLLSAIVVLPWVSHAANDRVYVQFAPGHKAAAQAALAIAGASVRHQFDDLNTVAASIPQQARAGLSRNPVIVAIEDDPERHFLSVPQETPYGITMVQAPLAVGAGATGAGVKIGVIDSGVFAAHEDFAGVAITGEPDHGPDDPRTWYRDHLGHGTHVVGTIAAANNDRGVIGVSPGAVSIHMVKVFGDTGGWVYSSDLLAAARAAVNAGSKIVSMSLGGGRPSRTEQRGLDDLYNNQNILLIAAAGNDGNTTTSYPAGYATIVSVAAVDEAMNVADFSQKNSDVEIAAPGVAVLSTLSYLDSSSVVVGASSITGNHIEFAARGTANGPLVYGGLGTDRRNPAWAGKVVLVDRGSISFYEKVKNVQNSGGVACVIANHEPGNFFGTLGERKSSTIPAISISQEDGVTLKASVGSAATVSSVIHNNVNNYELLDGTSMATPHVSGVAALVWSAYPTLTNAQLRDVLNGTALDRGEAGRDTSYGHGIVQAKAALDALAAPAP